MCQNLTRKKHELNWEIIYLKIKMNATMLKIWLTQTALLVLINLPKSLSNVKNIGCNYNYIWLPFYTNIRMDYVEVLSIPNQPYVTSFLSISWTIGIHYGIREAQCFFNNTNYLWCKIWEAKWYWSKEEMGWN